MTNLSVNVVPSPTDHSAEAEEASVQDMANEVNNWFPSCNKYVYISTRGSSVSISLTWLFNTFYIQSSLDFELKNISHWVLCSTLINLNRTWNKITFLGIVPFSISFISEMVKATINLLEHFRHKFYTKNYWKKMHTNQT